MSVQNERYYYLLHLSSCREAYLIRGEKNVYVDFSYVELWQHIVAGVACYE